MIPILARVPRTPALVLLLALVLPAAGVATASAEAPTRAPDSAAAAAHARVQSISTRIVVRRGKMIMRGRVQPAVARLKIQKATRCSATKQRCSFRDYRTVSVSKQGRYRVVVHPRKHGSFAWRARHRKATSPIWNTCFTGANQPRCPRP